MPELVPAHLRSLVGMLSRFARVVHAPGGPPDLFVAIVQGPWRHPLLHPDGLPPSRIPHWLRVKPRLNHSPRVPLNPPVRLHYFGDSMMLSRFLDFSQGAQAAMREALPSCEKWFTFVEQESVTHDIPVIVENWWPVAVRDAVLGAENAKYRATWWQETGPFDGDLAQVTIFPFDLFTMSLSALEYIIEESTPSPAPAEPPLQPKTPPRLTVRRDPPSITFDGIPYGVSLEGAAFVDLLFQNVGHLVEPKIFNNDPVLRNEPRRDHVKNRLPIPIRGLITGKPGGGYTLTIPPMA